MHVVTRTLVLAVTLAVSPSLAAAKQPPVGTVTFSQALGPLVVSSYAFGLSNATDTSGGGGGAGKVSFTDFAITRSVDSASPALMLLAAEGAHLATVTIAITNGDTPVTFTLTDVIVTSLRQAGSTDTTESLTLRFGRISMSVGGNTATWDVLTNSRV